MIPSPGRIVTYTLSEQDAEQINRRRRDAGASLEWHRQNKTGAVVHFGNTATAGEDYPMVIVRVWSTPPTPHACVNGQVLLDGNDTLWVTSVQQGTGPRTWRQTTLVME